MIDNFETRRLLSAEPKKGEMMSTATATESIKSTSTPTEMKVYMHSALLYWWPVWAIGYVMAAWTLLENHHMALVAEGSTVEGTTLTVPEGQTPVQTGIHMSASRIPGAIFALTFLIVLAFGSGWVRGWRAYTFVACFAFAILFVTWLEGWDAIARWLSYLRVHINLGGYLVLSTGLLVLWLVQFFIVDRRTFVVFSPSQVRVHYEIGEEEKVYDTMGIAFEKKPYDWFRWLFGFGAGDLRARLGGQWMEIPNVIAVGRQLAAIEVQLRIKDVE